MVGHKVCSVSTLRKRGGVIYQRDKPLRETARRGCSNRKLDVFINFTCPMFILALWFVAYMWDSYMVLITKGLTSASCSVLHTCHYKLWSTYFDFIPFWSFNWFSSGVSRTLQIWDLTWLSIIRSLKQMDSRWLLAQTVEIYSPNRIYAWWKLVLTQTHSYNCFYTSCWPWNCVPKKMRHIMYLLFGSWQ